MLITRKKDILVLKEGPTQGLDGTMLTADKKFFISFTENNKKFCGSFIIMGQIAIQLIMVQTFVNLKQKVLKLQHLHYVPFKKLFCRKYELKTGLNGDAYDFVLIMMLLQLMIY